MSLIVSLVGIINKFSFVNTTAHHDHMMKILHLVYIACTVHVCNFTTYYIMCTAKKDDCMCFTYDKVVHKNKCIFFSVIGTFKG